MLGYFRDDKLTYTQSGVFLMFLLPSMEPDELDANLRLATENARLAATPSRAAGAGAEPAECRCKEVSSRE